MKRWRLMRSMRKQHEAIEQVGCWLPAGQDPKLPFPRFGGSPEPYSLDAFVRRVEEGEYLLTQGTTTVPVLDDFTVKRLGFPGLRELPRELAARTYGDLFVTTARLMYFSVPLLARAASGSPALLPFIWNWSTIGAYQLARSPRLPWLDERDQPPLALQVAFMDREAPPLSFHLGSMLGRNVAAAADFYLSAENEGT